MNLSSHQVYTHMHTHTTHSHAHHAHTHTQGSRPGQSDEVVSHQLLDQFISAGGNFIDTADVYQHGLSEQIIGRYLVKRPEVRSKLIIATKVGYYIAIFFCLLIEMVH